MSAKNFDEQLREKILGDFDGTKGQQLVTDYNQTRLKLQQEVYPHIQGKEPSLSDHGTGHVLNVQENAISLLSSDGTIGDLSGIEVYCLGMCILFHDAGIIYGREDHQYKVGEVFDLIRGKNTSLLHEKTLIVRTTRAHTGTAQDGTNDTLKEVTEFDHLEGKSVRLRELAAILRFADELAEGPQRTSVFMQTAGHYEKQSQKFHDYANITHVRIDRGTGRVVLTYEINIDPNQTDKLRDRLDYTFKRIGKLNQERQYARNYSDILLPFKSTEVTFNFHCGSEPLDSNLSPLKLTDIVVPGEPTKDISDIDPAYSIDKIVENIIARCSNRNEHESGK